MDRPDPERKPPRDPNERDAAEYRSTPSRDVDERLDTDLAAESVGGITGALGGAAIGSLGGPVGAVIGAIAGAVGGWWVGQDAAETAANLDQVDEAAYREHFGSVVTPQEGVTYDDARAAYILGMLAGRNPDYTGYSFEQIEPELERGWLAARTESMSSWLVARDYARYAFLRERRE